jgi:hypothetical protein
MSQCGIEDDGPGQFIMMDSNFRFTEVKFPDKPAIPDRFHQEPG